MGNRPGWKQAWTIDSDRCLARHVSGLVIEFRSTADGWSGATLNREEALRELVRRHGHDAAMQMLPRLLREAGELYNRTLNERH